VQTFSHGEAYLTILQTRIKDKGIFMLDEPEAALSPLKQLSLLAFILEMLKTGKAQFIIASPNVSSTIRRAISVIYGERPGRADGDHS